MVCSPSSREPYHLRSISQLSRTSFALPIASKEHPGLWVSPPSSRSPMFSSRSSTESAASPSRPHRSFITPATRPSIPSRRSRQHMRPGLLPLLRRLLKRWPISSPSATSPCPSPYRNRSRRSSLRQLPQLPPHGLHPHRPPKCLLHHLRHQPGLRFPMRPSVSASANWMPSWASSPNS